MFGAVAATYVMLVLGFGVAYWAVGDLSEEGFASALFFSLVTQATVGYGDVLATGAIARVLVALQVSTGVAFVAFVPALVVVRLLAPAQGAITFSRLAIFDPTIGQFRFRFVNDSTLGAAIRGSIRLPVRISHLLSPNVSYTKHFHVRLEYQALPPAGTHVPILVRTEPCHPEPDPLDSAHDEIALHPGLLKPRRSVRVRLDVTYPMSGTQVVEGVFDHDHILCGQFADLTGQDGERSWRDFDVVELQPSAGHDGKTPCEQSCRFRGTCNLVNRIRPLEHVPP